jgi:hypothetical protein
VVMTKQYEHERCLELAALAEIGDVSEAEFLECQAHLAECKDCRSEAKRLNNLFYSTAIAGGVAEGPVSRALEFVETRSQDYRETDLRQRLNSTNADNALRGNNGLLPVSISLEQLPLAKSHVQMREFHSLGLIVGSVAAIALFAATWLGYDVWRERLLIRSQAARIDLLNSQAKNLQGQVSILDSKETDSHAKLQSELSVSRSESSIQAKRNADLEGRLKDAEQKAQVLTNRLVAEQESKSELARRVQDDQSRLLQMNQELDAIRNSERTQYTSAQDAKATESHLAELETRLAGAAEEIDRDKRLLAADRDIRNVMGARNLHIIDVIDVNGQGKNQKSFGRVFYTQGRSLIFYAFDLGSDRKRKGLTDAAFQVWGTQSWDQKSAQSLGIFYQEDKSDNRWVLKFDDPNVLAEIDSVFVTLEPPGGSKQPTGREILSAYLNSKINHP